MQGKYKYFDMYYSFYKTIAYSMFENEKKKEASIKICLFGVH